MARRRRKTQRRRKRRSSEWQLYVIAAGVLGAATYWALERVPPGDFLFSLFILFGGIVIATILLYVAIVGFKFVSTASRNTYATIQKEQKQLEELEEFVQINTIKSLRKLTPAAFERYVAQLFRAQGYRAIVTPEKGDGGIDVILEKDGTRIAVQAKRYTEQNVMRPEIQAFYGAYKDRYQRGIFVTTSGYSPGAREEAGKRGMRLIDKKELTQMIER